MEKKFEMTVATVEEIVFSISELIEITKNWGKDYWSLLAYFETRCVDYKGVPDMAHMRINSSKRGFNNGARVLGGSFDWQDSWGTRIKDGSIPDATHDDYDVMEELEKYGFIQNIGTGLNPVIKLTKIGKSVAEALRAHKADGKNFNSFTLTEHLKIA